MSSTVISQTGAADRPWTFERVRAEILKPLGSLKITCALLSISIFLVFVGSLAQARRDVWMVVEEYFRTWIAWVQVKDLFPPSMFPSLGNYDWESLGIFQKFPYPGGWTIGTLMCINLLAAHIARVRITVKGGRLVAGVIAMVVAVLVTGAIIINGNADGVQGQPLLGYDGVWYIILGSLAVTSVGALGFALGPFGAKGTVGRMLLLAIAAISGGALAHFIIGGEEARLKNESMRILWQLILGSISASALLAACWILFRKRAGIVVLHLGIIMLMYSELQVAMYGKENQTTLAEGEEATFLRDIRERELAIVLRDGDEQKVWVIPEHELKEAGDPNAEPDSESRIIRHDELPFAVRVRRYYVNSELAALDPEEAPKTSEGLGSFAMAVSKPAQNGMEDLPDISSVYIDILDEEDEVVATHLVSQEASELRGELAERATVGGETYELYLRSMRTYRPWKLKLTDVSRTNYIGTATPKDFRSEFVITDEEGTEHAFTTSMNNPVRFGGETFYQQGYQNLPGTGEITTLQIVKNTGWMLPYIACMVVSFGMFAQFGITLSRFLGRPVTVDRPQAETENRWITVGVPAFIILLMSAYMAKLAVPKPVPDNVMNLRQMARVPVAAGGRPQPFETFANNSLLMIRGKATFEGEMEPAELDANREKILSTLNAALPDEDWSALNDFNGDYVAWLDQIQEISGRDLYDLEVLLWPEMTKKRPAVWWMLDVIARPEVAQRHRIYRIQNDQLLSLLSLKQRPGLSYSAAEFEDRIPDLRDIYDSGREKMARDDGTELTELEHRVQELLDSHSRVRNYAEIFNPRPEQPEDSFGIVAEAWRLRRLLAERSAKTLIVPTGSEQEEWLTGVGADALIRVREVFDRLGIDDAESAEQKLLASIEESVPGEDERIEAARERIKSTVPMMIRMLEETEKESNPDIEAQQLANAVRQKAREASVAPRLASEPYLQGVMKLIAASPADADADQILASVTDEDLRQLAGDREVADGALAILETLERLKDHRSETVKTQLRRMISAGLSPAQAIESVTVNLVVEDLNKEAGHLLFADLGKQAPMDFAHKSIQSVFAAWRNGDVAGFNQTLKTYHQWLEDEQLPEVNEEAKIFYGLITVDKVDFESFVNGFAPGYNTIFLYLFALILTFLSWIGWRKPLWRSAVGLTIVALIVHSFYLYARMKISGRPPVTNLYSSAVFIGWGVVLLSLILEFVSKLGIMTVVGCVSGASTLCIAYFLGIDEGDTLSVMQAVLDTQFWLATHVVCITFGYAATFLAGLLGIAYCIFRVADDSSGKQPFTVFLGKVVYGVVCFAMLLSFVGTVLGGLWADDSWGRFWGWDPKENGALLIVIWNAIILHARWDKLVRDYGTAVLAIGGNIVTAWSWFGVNELGAGLHNYGFTEGRLFYLGMFVVGNLALIAAALIVRPWILKRGSEESVPT
ncbi:MAG: hypothetical protein Fues2KO_24060 [Fuerstiella sp.]